MTKIERKTKTTWRKVKLGEVVSPVSATFDFTKNEKVVFLNTSDIENGHVLNHKKIAPHNLPGQAKKSIKKGDILYSEIRPQNKHFARINFDAHEYVVSTRLIVLRPNDKYASDFSYLTLTAPRAIRDFQTIAESRSGTFPQITFDAIREYEVFMPDSKDQQQAIADTLSVFDDKIELNNKTSAAMEQMAQQIFKEWFVKKTKFKNQNAKLWKVKNVTDIVKRIPVGKKYDNKTALPAGKVPILDQGQSGCIGYHNDEPGVVASIDEPVVIFTNHTCNYRLITRPFSAIQNVLPYIGINGYPTLFVYYLTRGKITMQEYKGHWPEFEQQEFFVPPPDLAVEFASYVKPMVRKMVEAENENQKLAALRDLLLPKLMSGEIEVKK